MAFLHRLGYYLGGFSVGLILLFFLFNGKRTQCDYGPEARVLKNLSIKKWKTNVSLLPGMTLDSIGVQQLLSGAAVDFSQSNTKKDSCKSYQLEGFFKQENIIWKVENCANTVYLTSISLKP